MKKVKTCWSSCPQCNVIVSDRFIKRHEKDHNNDKDGRYGGHCTHVVRVIIFDPGCRTGSLCLLRHLGLVF